jgi:hypothetical protein
MFNLQSYDSPENVSVWRNENLDVFHLVSFNSVCGVLYCKHRVNQLQCLGDEVLTAVVVKSSIFCDIMPYSLLEVG